MDGFRRDRLTWTTYTLLGWFAYLQAAPGLVVTHLRRELDLSYSMGGLYVTAFAAGSTVSGVLSSRLEGALGRIPLLWSSVAVMGAGAVGLTVVGTSWATIACVLVMGLGGGLLLATVQAALADHHGDRRTVALAEANVVASCGYLLLVGGLALTAHLGVGWRAALLVSLVVPVVARWRSRTVEIDRPPRLPTSRASRLPPTFWCATVVLVCTTAVEWTVTAWGATFVQEVTRVSADTAVSLMGGYFGGFLAGRVLGSRLARRSDPARLLGWSLGVTSVGFAGVWVSAEPAPATLGLILLGMGVGNLFPMVVSVAVAAAPRQAGQASGRVVTASAGAVLLAPVTVGALADVTSLSAALGVVPVLLLLAAGGLVTLRRVSNRAAQPC